MYCTHCVFQNEESARFCESCGQPLGSAAGSPVMQVRETKPITISPMIPAIINLISCIFFSLVALAIIITALVGAHEFNRLLGYVPAGSYFASGSLLVIPVILITLFFLLPIIIANYRAYKGLRDGEYDGYKWGLVTAYMGVYILLLLFSAPALPSWFARLLVVAIPATALVCLLLGENLIKLSGQPVGIVMPAFFSLMLFYLVLLATIISAVYIVIGLVTVSFMLSQLSSFLGSLADQTALLVILSLIVLGVLAFILFVFHKVYRDLLDHRPNAHVWGIVVFGIITFVQILFSAILGYINLFGCMLIVLFALQVVVLAQKTTRQALNPRFAPNA
jgi:hypothetical protein